MSNGLHNLANYQDLSKIPCLLRRLPPFTKGAKEIEITSIYPKSSFSPLPSGERVPEGRERAARSAERKSTSIYKANPLIFQD